MNEEKSGMPAVYLIKNISEQKQSLEKEGPNNKMIN